MQQLLCLFGLEIIIYQPVHLSAEYASIDKLVIIIATNSLNICYMYVQYKCCLKSILI